MVQSQTVTKVEMIYRLTSFVFTFFYRLLRATAYRWLTRWLCGYLGWENSRPLPACVYHHVRTNMNSHNVTGYATSRERDT